MKDGRREKEGKRVIKRKCVGGADSKRGGDGGR